MLQYLFFSSLQNMLVQQLPDSNLCPWQQQLALGLMPDGLLKKNHGSRSTLLYSRLKEAVSHIARLTREKQQLIEMGNCLRAQITMAGLQGTMTNTLTTAHIHYIKEQVVQLILHSTYK